MLGLGFENNLFFAHVEELHFQPWCVPVVVEGCRHGSFPLSGDAQALLLFFVPCKGNTLVRFKDLFMQTNMPFLLPFQHYFDCLS